MFSYNKGDQVSDEDLNSYASPLRNYAKFLKEKTFVVEYDGMETSINLPFDESIADETCRIAKHFSSPRLKYIFVCGIGGSNLGPRGVYDALTGMYDMGSNMIPKVLFIDTLSPILHTVIRELVDEQIDDPDEFVLSVVSKSGSTTETIANADTLYAFIRDKFGHVNHRVVLTTEKGSKLWKVGEKEGFMMVDHRNVGGRFSIMSPVGQLPLRLAGFDVDMLLQGARDMRNQCLSVNVKENPAMASAVLQYHYLREGCTINDNFFFNQEMESIGKWYRQLMGESLGKRVDLDGNEIHNGITPTVSIGSTDLHSMAQLYLGGPRNKFFNFVYSPQGDLNVFTNSDTPFSNIVDSIADKNLQTIMDAIYNGVIQAYINEQIPFMEVTLKHITEYTLGQYMQMKMMEMMFLGKLMHVNTFNQPSVEIYKEETRKLLSQS